MRTQLRIVAGSLRGRKLTCTVEPGMRPIPDMVRQALFNILMNDVPDRPFFDLFAGTGAVGMEALSRGSGPVVFLERDVRVAGEIVRHLHAFQVEDDATVLRADVYRWAERWQAPAEPVTVFLGPPFPDLERRRDDLVQVLTILQQKVAPESIIVLQNDRGFDPAVLAAPETWEHRLYGRNRLSFWTK